MSKAEGLFETAALKRHITYWGEVRVKTGLASLDVAAELHFGDNGAYRVC